MVIYLLSEVNSHWSAYRVHPEPQLLASNIGDEDDAYLVAKDAAQTTTPSVILRIKDHGLIDEVETIS